MSVSRRPDAARRTTARVGRPRAQGPSASGLEPREQVLAAAAALFTENGYAATTTRAVAERAGLRQASMYHYFARKEDILATLLESTVEPSLAFARALLADTASSPQARLWALAARDTALLFGGLSNLGALYQLPEVRGERFARFRAARADLRAAYGSLLAAAGHGGDDPELAADLLLGLVEGGVAVAREPGGRTAPQVARALADAVLRFAGCSAGQREAARPEGERLLRESGVSGAAGGTAPLSPARPPAPAG
ncbi:TetR family transcriptional regulator [Kitasatospora sp. NE20-6]|uniref:TetR/AcrR family transcriptional regulator n=1 Tax=Kitasatospora sp. NE20-6 TaxID=2859066 RepID=UPI0034DB836B